MTTIRIRATRPGAGAGLLGFLVWTFWALLVACWWTAKALIVVGALLASVVAAGVARLRR